MHSISTNEWDVYIVIVNISLLTVLIYQLNESTHLINDAMPHTQKGRELMTTYNWAIPSLQIWLVVDVNNCRQQVLKQKNFKSRHRTSIFGASDHLP